MVDQATSDAAMARLAEHLQYLANMLIDAGSALPDGEPWVKVSGVALELTRLARQFGTAQRDGRDDLAANLQQGSEDGA